MGVVINEEDLGKTRLQLLTDLIYEYNGIRIPESKVVYGDPEVLDPRPDIEDDPNTIIKFHTTPDYDESFLESSNAKLFYRRRELSTHFDKITRPIELYVEEDITSTHDLIEQLNFYLTYPLDPADILNITHNTIPGQGILTITASKKSLFWIGSANINVTYSDTQRMGMLWVTNLNGFNLASI